jgi:hypothetical protein
VYARQINEEEFTFGVSGKLIRNALVMYDRQTESYWSQMLGEAVAGPMIGTKLEFLPSWMMTWEQWKELHPDTVALDKEGRRGSRDTYDSYYASGRPGVIEQTNVDERLYTKEFVIGAELGDTAIAYPFSMLNAEPLINDSVDNHDLLVIFDPNEASGVVFDRNVRGQLLTFVHGEAEMTLIDEETGTLWDAFSGEAIKGPLAGEQLERVKSTIVFWFGWVDFHPDTLIYGTG